MKKKVMAAIAAIAAVAASTAWFQTSVSADSFVEYKDWASIEDVVAIRRAAAGDPVLDYQWADVIRLDVDFDGTVSDHDADIMEEYIKMYHMFDSVNEALDHDSELTEVKDLFRMEMSEKFGIPFDNTMYFHAFRAEDLVPDYQDYIMIEPITTIADGGMTGFVVQEDPYFGDITYGFEYEQGDIVWIFNTYINGDPHHIVRQDEFLVGNVSDFGFEYTPRQEIVERALANID